MNNVKKFLVLAGVTILTLVLQGQPQTNGVALTYFAPENQLFYRMRYAEGGYREFQRSLDDLRVMDGANGWKAVLAGGTKIIVTGKGPKGPERYEFANGRLVSCTLAGEVSNFAYNDERIVPEGAEPPFHFGSEQEALLHTASHAKAPKSAAQLLKGKWAKSGRLRWPFENPNENGYLYASFALLSLYLMVFSRRALKIAGAVLFFAFFIPTLLTGSRGSLLAMAVGMVPPMLVHFRVLLRSKWTYVVVGVAVLMASAYFATHIGQLKRGFTGKSSWSNEARLDMWNMASPMMVDAPGGWKINSGKAYLDWYEDFACFTAPGSLINDHLSKMVRMSWPVRGLYAFGWFALILGLAFTGFKSKNAVPAGLVASYAVACWFNPLMINPWLWTAPILSLVTVLFDKPWRHWRRWLVASGCGVMLSVAALLTIVWLANRTPRPYGLSISADGPRVSVNGFDPRVWIVDDGHSLGGAFACKELRASMAAMPQAEAVGYVRSCADLPAKPVSRLVLGGRAGDEWLRAICSDASLRERLPKEVVFISPPFPPSAIPPPLLTCASVKYVTGEFNARYEPELKEPSEWVEIVPAMELYLANWMRYAVRPLE